MDKALISIVMATYNGSKYIKEQLDSIYNQTYTNCEVMVVDDASDDDTVSILEAYKRKYGLKYTINENNLGVTKNFEKAISLCTGDYIALVDQDDVWLPNKLEVLYNNIGEYSLIYSNAEIIDEQGNSLHKNAEAIYPLYGLDSTKNNLYFNIILQGILLGSATMFKKELIATLLPMYISGRNHDWWLQVCAHNKNGIKYIDDILFQYRHHDNNVSRGKGQSFIKTVLNYYSYGSRASRKEKIIEQLKIVKYLLVHKLFKTQDEKDFLLDIESYCLSSMQTIVHFKAYTISSKYEKYMFFHRSVLKNKLNLFSRLIR